MQDSEKKFPVQEYEIWEVQWSENRVKIIFIQK